MPVDKGEFAEIVRVSEAWKRKDKKLKLYQERNKNDEAILTNKLRNFLESQQVDQ